ncbi:MAG: hypothetical protein O7E52_19545 [Candidatus Poribacteria bacterium]|nr:hypothetical protein [Candidatus Poribacteria bacterium]
MNPTSKLLQFFRERPNFQGAILLLPALFWLTCFFLIPIGYIFVYSFAQRGTYGGIRWVLSVQNYQRLLDPLYLGILWRSISTGIISTRACLLIGYPFAYYLARHQYRWRNLL